MSYTINEYIYSMTFWIRQNYIGIIGKSLGCQELDGSQKDRGKKKRTGGNMGMKKLISILIMVMVTQLYTFVKTPTTKIKKVNFYLR